MSPLTGPKNPVSSDPYSVLENSVYWDKTQCIKGIRHYPVFVSAITQLAEEAKAKGSPVLVACHVGAAELVFTDQSNFKHISQQSGIYEALYGVQELIDCSLTQSSTTIKNWCIFADTILKIIKDHHVKEVAKEAKEHAKTHHCDDAHKAHKCCQEHDSDMEMMKMHINKLFTCFLLFLLSPQPMPEVAPEAKKPHLQPSIASYYPDSSCTQALLDKTDCILAKDGKVSHSTLCDYTQTLNQTACQQLFALDITQQLCKQLIAHHEAVKTALDNQDIADTSILIHDLQVASDLQLPAVIKNSPIEVSGMDSKVDKVANAIEATL
ncbi:hypothetical protein J132_03852 [Termitomyces sp. J132]|nr:hypothetical protein H2248_005012 [Termitomyces sp. 'cryptogamus']KNZ77793.1 hypothetical protein J132_03852 [Termitomyces sp. J132]